MQYLGSPPLSSTKKAKRKSKTFLGYEFVGFAAAIALVLPPTAVISKFS
jgi:hypothetical protein